MQALSPELWRLLLDRAGGEAFAPDLYRPLIAPPSAADGCFVLGRMAQSLDGRIATPNGASRWISGPDDILHTHRLRALCDAIVIGAGTIRADDPQLTTRACDGPSPVRIVIGEPRGLHADHRVFSGEPPTLLICAPDSDCPAHVKAAEVIRVPRGGDGLDIGCLIGALAKRGLRRLLVEGGGITVSRFLAAGALDRLHVTVAPLLLGSGVPSFTLPPVAAPSDGLRVDWTVHPLGADLLLDVPLNRTRLAR